MVAIDLTGYFEEKYLIRDEDGNWKLAKNAPQWAKEEFEEFSERLNVTDEDDEQ